MSPDPLTIMHPFVNEGENLAVVAQENNYADAGTMGSSIKAFNHKKENR